MEKMVETGIKVIRTDSTKGTEKKLLGDSMKTNKSATVKRKRLKKVTLIEDKN